VSYVCTWCALPCASRVALEAHWEAEPDCARQRGVSNQTQSKYGDASNPLQYRLRQGEETLQRVERREDEREAGVIVLPVRHE
jgi:hypothetical protein